MVKVSSRSYECFTRKKILLERTFAQFSNSCYFLKTVSLPFFNLFPKLFICLKGLNSLDSFDASVGVLYFLVDCVLRIVVVCKGRDPRRLALGLAIVVEKRELAPPLSRTPDLSVFAYRLRADKCFLNTTTCMCLFFSDYILNDKRLMICSAIRSRNIFMFQSITSHISISGARIDCFGYFMSIFGLKVFGFKRLLLLLEHLVVMLPKSYEFCRCVFKLFLSFFSLLFNNKIHTCHKANFLLHLIFMIKSSFICLYYLKGFVLTINPITKRVSSQRSKLVLCLLVDFLFMNFKYQ